MSTNVNSDQLSVLLFKCFVLDDEQKILEKDLGQYILNTEGQNLIFRKYVYFYLTALVAVALTAEYESRENIAQVIPKFRIMVSQEAQNRWNIFQEEVDDLIEEESKALSKLFFTDPQKAPSLGMEWGIGWLKKVGVTRYNPITVFKISMFWKLRFTTIMKTLREFDLVLT
jgi:hypothetical protein